ncbi:MAG: DUF1800 family protein, partial [Bacteroidota bacterium]
MDRRSFLSSTVKKNSESGDPPLTRNKYANKAQPKFKKSAAAAGIAPYSGPWERKHIRHLLNRTMYGCTPAQMQTASSMTMDQLVSLLLTPVAAPAPPLYNYYNEGIDPDCTMGGTWINAPYNADFDGLRVQSLKDWWLQQMLEQGISIQEKMTVLLQNCASIQFYSVLAAQYAYDYNVLCRSYALGNYKSFIHDMGTNKAMLIYLNGYKNQKNNPDENF